MQANHASSRTFTLALLAALLWLTALAGAKLGAWPFRLAFLMILAAAVLAIVALLSVGLGLVRRRTQPQARRGWAVLLALLPLGFLASPIYLTLTHPVIHDITTDWEEPPQFVAARHLRRPGDHSVDYLAAENAPLQQQAFPDIQPLRLSVPPQQAFDWVREVLTEQGLDIVTDEPEQGRLEAVATSWLFEFKDDVVVRIRPQGSGSRIDIRSMSRIGRSDLGANARRVRQILEALNAKAQAAA